MYRLGTCASSNIPQFTKFVVWELIHNKAQTGQSGGRGVSFDPALCLDDGSSRPTSRILIKGLGNRMQDIREFQTECEVGNLSTQKGDGISVGLSQMSMNKRYLN